MGLCSWIFGNDKKDSEPSPVVVPAPINDPSIDIAVVNRSTVVSDDAVRTAVAAVQIQIDRDFYPVWDIPASLKFFDKDAIIPDPFWEIVILDDADMDGALGYHELTPAGEPLAKVFAKTDAEFGLNWTITFSHEVLEMIVDPYINLTVLDQDSNTTGMLYAYEVCDATQADQFGYQINGVWVSDFVYPAWFDPYRIDRPGQDVFDHMRRCTRPFEILSGGYMPVFEVRGGSGWTQIFNGRALRANQDRYGAKSRFRKRSNGPRRLRRSRG